MDKHKMDQFLHAARPTVATVYAPIHFGTLPVLVFAEVCAWDRLPMGM